MESDTTRPSCLNPCGGLWGAVRSRLRETARLHDTAKLVLASASPRRHELLRNAGIAFVAHPANVSELPQPGESGRNCAERLARERARAVFHQLPDHVILGADTVVIV